MLHLPAEYYLGLRKQRIARHLEFVDRSRLATARARAHEDQRELDRAWRALAAALEAESRSRHELAELTS